MRSFFEILPAGPTPAAAEAREAMSHLAGSDIGEVEVSRVYIITGELSGEDRRRIAEELLCDRVIEKYRLEDVQGEGVSVTVGFRPGVLDAEGNTLMEALKIMGIEGVESASSLRRFVFAPQVTAQLLSGLAPGALYNPVVEEAEIKQ